MGEYKTPGVYIQEKNAFGTSVVEVETAVPVFIGLTEKATDGATSLLNKAVRISSMTEYEQYFGGANMHKFKVTAISQEPEQAEDGAIYVFDKTSNRGYQAEMEGNLCTLYYHMVMYFANGGGTCYVISIGDYGQTIDSQYTQHKDAIFDAIRKEQDITLPVMPEAVNSTKCMDIYTDLMTDLCKDKKYFFILDIPEKFDDGVEGNSNVEKFQTKIGTNNLSYAAAYCPWLETSVLSDNDIDGSMMEVTSGIQTGNTELDNYITSLSGTDEGESEEAKKQKADSIHNALLQHEPAYKMLVKKVKESLNRLPPSAAMAGIYASVDGSRGVWKAPANVAVNYVNKPVEAITDEIQKNLNVPMSGKAVNAIRTFPGEGVKVWGARTLDGNSQDWRYINVRRTMLFLEQSVKNAARAYVFEPNDANTWMNMRCMIENFLRSVWKRGGLAGSTPEEAYEVHVGLGDTMTGDDILEGILRITVLVAVSHPAEFIEITFQQQMQKS